MPKLSNGQVILFVNGKIKSEHMPALIETAGSESDPNKVTVLGVNDFDLKQKRITGIKISQIAESFEIDRNIVRDILAINPGINDEELASRLSRASEKTNIDAFNLVRRNNVGNIESRRRIVKKKENLTIIEDLGTGRFSGDVLLYVRRLNSWINAACGNAAMPSIPGLDVSQFMPGGIKMPASSVISDEDPLFKDVLPFGSREPGSVCPENITIEEENGKIILKVGEVSFQEDAIDEYAETVPESEPFLKGSRLWRNFLRRLQPLLLWIMLAPNPKVRGMIFVVSAAGILSCLALPLFGATIATSGIMISTALISIPAMKIFERLYLNLGSSEHAIRNKLIFLGITAVLVAIGAYFAALPLLEILGSLSLPSWLNVMRLKPVLMPIMKYAVIVIASFKLLKKGFISGKNWVWDHLIKPKKKRTVEVSEEIIGFNAAKKAYDDSMKKNAKLVRERFNLPDDTDISRSQRSIFVKEKAEKILRRQIGLSDNETLDFSLIDGFINVSLADKKTDALIKELADKFKEQAKLRGQGTEGGKPDPDKAIKLYEFAIYLNRHRLLMKGADKRIIYAEIARTGKQISDIKDHGIKDAKPLPSAAKDIDAEIKEAANAALGSGRNPLVRLYLRLISEGIGLPFVRKFELYNKAERTNNDEMHIILAELALSSDDKKAASEHISRILSDNADTKTKLRKELRGFLSVKEDEQKEDKAKTQKEDKSKQYKTVILSKFPTFAKYILPIVITSAYVFRKTFGGTVAKAVGKKMPGWIMSNTAGKVITKFLIVPMAETFKTISMFVTTSVSIPFAGVVLPMWGIALIVLSIILLVEITAAIDHFMLNRREKQELTKVSQLLEQQNMKKCFPWWGFKLSSFSDAARIINRHLDLYDKESDENLKKTHFANAKKTANRLKKRRRLRKLDAMKESNNLSELLEWLQVSSASLRIARIENEDEDELKAMEKNIAETIKNYISKLNDENLQVTDNPRSLLVIIADVITVPEDWKETIELLNVKLIKQQENLLASDEYTNETLSEPKDRPITPRYTFEKDNKSQNLDKLHKIMDILAGKKDKHKNDLDLLKDNITAIEKDSIAPIDSASIPQKEKEKTKEPDTRIKELIKKITKEKEGPGFPDSSRLAELYYKLASAYKEKSEKPDSEEMRQAEFYLSQAQSALLSKGRNTTQKLVASGMGIFKEEALYRGLPAFFLSSVICALKYFGITTAQYKVPILILGEVPLLQVLFFAIIAVSAIFFIRSHKEESFAAPSKKWATRYSPDVLSSFLSVFLPWAFITSGVFTEVAVIFIAAVLIHATLDMLIFNINAVIGKQLLGYALTQKNISEKGWASLTNENKALWNDIYRNLTEIKLARKKLYEGIYLKERFLKEASLLTQKDMELLRTKLNAAETGEEKKELKDNLNLAIKNLNELTSELLKLRGYKTLYRGVPIWNWRKKSRRAYLNVLSAWLDKNQKEFKELKQEKAASELSGLDTEIITRLSGLTEQHAFFALWKARLSAWYQNRKVVKQKERKQKATNKVNRLEGRLKKVETALGSATSELKSKTHTAEILLERNNRTLKEEQIRLLNAYKEKALKEISARLDRNQNPGTIKKIIETTLKPIIKNDISIQINTLENFKNEDVGDIINDYIAPIANALILQTGENAKDNISVVLVPLFDSLILRKRELIESSDTGASAPLLNFQTEVNSPVISAILDEIFKNIKPSDLNSTAKIDLKNEIYNCLSEAWIEKNSFLKLQQDENESSVDYAKRQKKWINNAQNIKNIYDNTVLPFLEDPFGIQESAVKKLAKLLNDPRITKETIEDILSKALADLQTKPKNKLLLTVTILCLEKTIKDEEGKYDPAELDFLIDKCVLLIKELPIEKKKEYENKLVGFIYDFISDKDKRFEKISFLLSDNELKLSKHFLTGLFSREMGLGERVSAQIITTIIKHIADDKSTLIGEGDIHFTFPEICDMLEKVLVNTHIPLIDKSMLVSTEITAITGENLDKIEQIIKLCEKLTANIENADNYTKAIQSLEIFWSFMTGLYTVDMLEINEDDSEKIKIQKENIIISTRNMLAKVLFEETKDDPKQLAVKNDNDAVFINLTNLYNDYKDALKKLKESQKKETERLLKESKEQKYWAHIYKSRSFEVEGNYKEATLEE
ncbi:MAG: hypothetical protein KJ864_06840 [Candidatus Omnitrophica bacterium]|nr:hypothetical protein [Candidatus Omnitrophota bacterium]